MRDTVQFRKLGFGRQRQGAGRLWWTRSEGRTTTCRLTVLKPSLNISLHCIIDRLDVGQNGANITSQQALHSAAAHSSRDQNFAVSNRFNHLAMPMFCFWSVVMVSVLLMALLTFEVHMPIFVSRLAFLYMTILDCHDDVVLCPAEVLTNGFSIVGNYSDLQCLNSPPIPRRSCHMSFQTFRIHSRLSSPSRLTVRYSLSAAVPFGVIL